MVSLIVKEFTLMKFFLPVISKDPFRTFMALVAYFTFELQHMELKIAFLNRKLLEEIYMSQP